jgi:hypothetical protein
MGFEHSQSEFAAALVAPDLPLPAGVTSARGAADASRFAVYRNNVHVGLTKAIASRFPTVEKLVGTEFFQGMARLYVADRKPVSPLIFAYGDDFPDFVAGFAPAASVPYLADVARIEAAWTRAYHAVDAAPLTVADLGALPPEALAELRLAPHPAATLVVSAYPAGSIWAAHQGDDVTPLSTRDAETVLVARPDMAVDVHVLPARDARFAAALFAGESLGAAAAQAMGSNSDFDFGAALVGLTALGAFAGLSPTQGPTP